MPTPINNDHPVMIATLIEEQYGAVEFEFSNYVYIPQTVGEHREPFLVRGEYLTKDFVSRLIGELKEGQELAFHSRVKLPDGTILHIPMLDFVGKHIVKDWSTVDMTLPKELLERFYLFDSGRSFHGYSLHLISEREWMRFMGALLLMNLPLKSAIVDHRWVGHRLRGGFSALRWSCNTSHYKKIPQLFGQFGPLAQRTIGAEVLSFAAS